MLSLEKKYIKLLEQKIEQLEKSLAAKDKLNGDSNAPSTDGVASDNTKHDSGKPHEESGDEKKTNKESSDKVRYLLLDFYNTHPFIRKTMKRPEMHLTKTRQRISQR